MRRFFAFSSYRLTGIDDMSNTDTSTSLQSGAITRNNTKGIFRIRLNDEALIFDTSGRCPDGIRVTRASAD
jgi:hypothetical protein